MLLPWLLLAAAALLRLLVAFPSHKYALDADCTLGALGAFRVLHGDFPVFLCGVRLGSLVSYELAPLFQVFDFSRTVLAAQPLIVNLLTLAVWWLFLREALGHRGALLALPFAAVPSPALTFWTYMPNSYPETILFCATSLWLACRLGSGHGGRVAALGLGVAIGLGLWNSLQTLECTLPALLWLFWQRTPRRGRALAPLLAAGFLLGAAPLLAFNVRHPWGIFQNNFATRPAAGITQALDNGRHFLVYDLPELVAAPDPEKDFRPPNRLAAALRWPVFVVSCLALVWLLIPPLAGSGARQADPQAGEAARGRFCWLLALVPLTTFGLVLISEAGAHRVLTVRYVLPIALVLPAGLALLLTSIARRWPWLAASMAALVLLFNLCGTLWPWTASRRLWAANAGADRRLVAALQQQRIGAVAGSYWKVYPINFLSREKILGIPVEHGVDYYAEEERLRARPGPLPWALVSFQPADIDAWVRQARLEGKRVSIPPLYSLFLVDRGLASNQMSGSGGSGGSAGSGGSYGAVLQQLRAAYVEAALPSLSRH